VMARFSLPAASKERRSAEPEALSEQASASPREPDVAVEVAAAAVAVVSDAPEEPRPAGSAWAAEVGAAEAEVAVWAVGAAQPREAAAAVARAGVAVLPRVAEVPDVRALRPGVVPPSAAAWVCRRGRLRRRRPAPQPAARLARAMERQRIAMP